MLLGRAKLGIPRVFNRGTPSLSPGNVTGLRNWYDFTSVASVTKDGSNKISAVADKSGQGNTLTAAGAARPTFVDTSTAPSPTTVPSQTTFWSIGAEWAAYIHTYQLAEGLASGNALLSTYYDAEYCRYLLADHFADTVTYYAQADRCNTCFGVNYVRANGGSIPGYWAFGQGLAERFLRRADANGLSDLVLLCANAAYHGTSITGFSTIEGNYADVEVDGHELSREWSYCILNYIQLERCQSLTAGQEARRDFCYEDLFRIAGWWVDSASYVRPFMVGILCHALISYYENVTAEARVITTIQSLLDYCINTCWIEGYKTFYYTDREDSLAPWSAGSLDRDPTGTPTLNMLIAPAFGWLWKKTGRQTYRTYGDKLHAGGLAVYSGGAWSSGSYLGTQSASAPLGKEFDQQFVWGQAYAGYAEATAEVASGVYKTTFDGTANGMTATNGATAQPSTTVVVCNCTGSTAANRTIYDTTGHEIGRYNTSGNIELNVGSSLATFHTRGNKEMFTFIENGASSSIRKNSGLVVSGAAGANAPGATLYLGETSSGTLFFPGDFYEFCRYNKVLNASELSIVEGSLLAKHGIAAYVPFDATTYGTVTHWADFTLSANVLNAGSTAAVDTDPIMTINDRSASAYNLTQGTAGSRPVCKTNIVNGLQIARFDGGDGWGYSTTQSGTITKNRTGLTFAAVINTSSLAGNQIIFSHADNNVAYRSEFYLLNGSGNFVLVSKPQDGGSADTQFWTSGISTSTWYVIVVRQDFAGNTAQAWLNNVSKGTAATIGSSGNSSNTNPAFGDACSIYFNNFGGGGLVGDAGEIITWDGAMSDANIAAMATSLGAKYGLTI